MSIKSSSGKAKARLHQQWSASMLIEEFNLEQGDAVSCPLGSPGEDVILSPHAKRVLGISVECKARKDFDPKVWLKQAERNADGRTPVVFWKPHGMGPEQSFVIMRNQDFITLLKAAKGGKDDQGV